MKSLMTLLWKKEEIGLNLRTFQYLEPFLGRGKAVVQFHLNGTSSWNKFLNATSSKGPEESPYLGTLGPKERGT